MSHNNFISDSCPEFLRRDRAHHTFTSKIKKHNQKMRCLRAEKQGLIFAPGWIAYNLAMRYKFFTTEDKKYRKLI